MVFALNIWRHYLYGGPCGSVYRPKKCSLRIQSKGVKYLTSRCLELLKDYDMNVLYHPGKHNIVEDVLNHLSIGSVAHIQEAKRNLVRDVHRLAV